MVNFNSKMNVFCFLSVLTTVSACCSGSPHPILGPYIAVPHNLHYDPTGVQRVPVALVHHDRDGANSSPLARHAAVPSAFANHAAAPVAVNHHAAVPSAFTHHAAAPVAVTHHATAPVAVAHHAAAAPVAVTHHASHVTHGLPAIAVSHHTPGVTVAHGVAPAVHINSQAHGNHVIPVIAQYHAQDELGQYAFGYDSDTSSRDESRDAYGTVRGTFSYLDPYGEVQTQNYVADDSGFRVTGTNLPVQVTDDHDQRYKRSYATFPASTGPLTSGTQVGPVVHEREHVYHNHEHVYHKAAPVVHNVAPVFHYGAPVVHGAPVGLGYAGVPRYGYSSHTGPSFATYRNYDHPIRSYNHHY